MPNVANTYIAETPNQARAAVTGRTVLYVLMFGTLGALGAFAIVYLYFFA